MKKALLPFILMFIFTFSANAQENRRNFDVDKFKKDRIDFLVREVGLTSDKAQQFEPLCNEILSKKFYLNRELRHKTREIKEKGSAATNADYEQLNNLQNETEKKEAELEKEYDAKFKTFMSAEKIYKYKEADKIFMRKIVKDHYKR